MTVHGSLVFPSPRKAGAALLGFALGIGLLPVSSPANDPTASPGSVIYPSGGYTITPAPPPPARVTTQPQIPDNVVQPPKLFTPPPCLSSDHLVTLYPVRIASSEVDQVSTCSAFGAPPVTSKPPARFSSLMVGWTTSTVSCSGSFGGGHYLDSQYYRGAVFFDTSKINWHKVSRAWLVLPSSNPTSSQSCAVTVSNAASPWWTQSGPIETGAFAMAVMPANNYIPRGEARFDVDAIGIAWALGVPDYGFVLQGAHEDMAPGTCLTTYTNPTLVVWAR